MFSKVFRSLAQFTLVNSVSTLLNKGGSTCNCPKLLRTSTLTKTNKQVHSYSAPALCSPHTSEARVGETAARPKNTLTQSNTYLLGMSQEHLRCLLLIMANLETCQHAKVMPQTCQGHADVCLFSQYLGGCCDLELIHISNFSVLASCPKLPTVIQYQKVRRCT